MQSRFGNLIGPTFLLFVSVGPALAMDASASEETNCLMACDANQENCQAHNAAGKPGLRAAEPAREAPMSRSLRAGAIFSQVSRSVAPKERPRQ